MLQLINPARHLTPWHRHWRSYPLPSMIIDSSYDGTAYYQFPEPSRDSLGNTDLSRGALVFSPNPSASTILHEWRHHLQFLRYGQWTPSYYDSAGRLMDHAYNACPYERDAYTMEWVWEGVTDEIVDGRVPAMRLKRLSRLEAMDAI